MSSHYNDLERRIYRLVVGAVKQYVNDHPENVIIDPGGIAKRCVKSISRQLLEGKIQKDPLGLD